MIKRPVSLTSTKISMKFNFADFTKLEVDLPHINKYKRSDFNICEVRNIITKELNGVNIIASANQKYKDEDCYYYVKKIKVRKKSYKLVFCICSDQPKTIGVITLYQY